MKRSYIRIGTLQLEEVFQAMRNGTSLKYHDHELHIQSRRLLTYFVHGTKCIVPGCCVEGKYFAVERAPKDRVFGFHLNLYGEHADGRELMMTSDHKLPKSLGGGNEIGNRQPMCSPHNLSKGNKLIHL